MKRVVVTGLGMINSVGMDKEESFSAILDGVCGIKQIELFDIEKFSVKIAGEIRDFDPSSVMDAKEVKKADRFIQLGIKAANEAMLDANFTEEIDKDRIGNILSFRELGGLPNIEEELRNFAIPGGPRRNISFFYSPFILLGSNFGLGGF